jgi:type VI secretion system protein ImpL
MKISKITLFAIAALAVWLILSWVIGLPLHVTGPRLWVLRTGLMVLGAIGFVAVLVWQSAGSKTEPESPASAGSQDDVDFVFREAARRLRSANSAQGGEILTLATVFVLGEAGSAKTSIIAHSGLEPELLAGHAFNDSFVAPTRSLNLWLTRNVVFVDSAGKMLSDEASRRRIFHKFGPAGVRSVIRGAAPPPRAVVLTLDCETFLQPGASELLASKARSLENALGDLTQELGTGVPVYVLFTKADRIPYFREWAEALSESESAEVLGTTLPFSGDNAGVYSEQQSRRVSDAFQQLYYSLSDKRTALLSRQHDTARLPNIYEFSREFGKIRPLLVQFLVDVFRPSQLRINPFLRGFYFTGVRPVVIHDPTPARVVQASRADHMSADLSSEDAGATRVFLRQSGAPSIESSQQASRRVPQWVFLRHLFTDLILADYGALGLTRGSVKVSFRRRVLLTAAAVIAVLLGCAWIGSYWANRNLLNIAMDSAAELPQISTGELPALDSLRKLENVRETIERLEIYARDGAPVFMRWGLYAGNKISPSLRQIYFDSFRRLLLGPTQQTLIAVCSQPPKLNDVSSYHVVYDSLKAYLISTNHHEKSTRDFLSPVLVQNWLNGRQIDSARLALAQKQFDFYSGNLAASNPFPRSAIPNENAVAAARTYLNQFGYQQRVYQVMLADASKDTPSIVFNQMFPGSADVVVNAYRVPGDFSKDGYAAFQKELQNPDKYLAGEEWVLGPASKIPANNSELVQAIEDLYRGDYLKTWRAYLKSTSVVPYRSLQDAAGKLERIVGNQSPLLSVLCVASTHTAVPDKTISGTFQPLQSVTPPGCLDHLASQSNAPYLDGLTRLGTSLGQVAANPGNDAARMQVSADAGQAEAAALQLERGFSIDRQGGVDEKTSAILQAPIESVKRLVQGLGPAETNGQAKSLCAQMQPLLLKYPFAPQSPIDTTIADLDAVFRQPDGALWTAYAQTFQKLMIRQGIGWTRAPGQPVTVRDAFLRWFGRATSISDALFRNGSQNPGFSFALRPVLSDDVDSVTLEIDGQSAMFTKASTNPQQFTWPGNVQDVKLQVRFVGGSAFNFPAQQGVWAVFRWLDLAEQWQPLASSQYGFENTLRTTAGPVTIPSNGHAATVKFALDPMGSPLRPGFFSGLSPCVATAVQ